LAWPEDGEQGDDIHVDPLRRYSSQYQTPCQPVPGRRLPHETHRCDRYGGTATLRLTTNATLLKEETVDYLDQNRFGISVSMDGPAAVHDRHRRTVRGTGTYDMAARGIGVRPNLRVFPGAERTTVPGCRYAQRW
jgi:hypothetical protein